MNEYLYMTESMFHHTHLKNLQRPKHTKHTQASAHYCCEFVGGVKHGESRVLVCHGGTYRHPEK